MAHPLKWDLRFRTKDLEMAYTSHKSNFQKQALYIFLMTVLVIFIGTYGINPYNRPNFEGIPLIFLIGLIIWSLAVILLVKKKPNYAENLVIISFIFFLFGFLESTQKNRIFWGGTHYFLVGCLVELHLMTLIMSKIDWKKSASLTILSSALICFRYMDFGENYSSKFYPLVLFIENCLVIIAVAYLFEKHDRIVFSTLKMDEFSLKCFKEMISEVIPSSIIITDGDSILFQNKESMKAFDSSDEDPNTKFKRMLITNKDFNKNFNFFASESNKENDPNQIALNIDEETLYNFLEKHKNKLESNIFQTFQISHNQYKEKLFDVCVKNIMWEKKPALMFLISENLLNEKFKILNEQSIYKDRLLATVSHDLRTPLNGVMGMIGISLESELEHSVRKNLTIAQRSSHLLLSMINDILDFSQMANGKLRLSYGVFSICEVVKEVSNLIKFQAKKKGLSFQKINSLKENFMIKSDQNRLKQILLNLLGNALKFTEKGYIRISIEKLNNPLNNGRPSSGIILRVEDTGIGIKKEDLSKLFKIFGKLESTETKAMNANGIGLGLAISQSLVKLLNKNEEGFEIKVQSEVGKGTCFWFELINELENELEEDFVPNEALKTDEGFGMLHNFPYSSNTNLSSLKNQNHRQVSSILIVDDDLINVMVATSYLKTEKEFVFETAHNGSEAIEKIKIKSSQNEFFDLILMDCNMPKMNGFEASIMVRNMISEKSIPDLKIIACTANAAESDYYKTKECGMNDYITKPFTKAELIHKIKRNLSHE